MTDILIPYAPPETGLEKENDRFQKRIFLQNRENLLRALGCIGDFTESVRKLRQDQVYKFVFWPEGAHLYKDAEGNLQAVFYRNGKILQHGRLREVRPSMANAATALGAQVLLIGVAMQLNRIEKEIDSIKDQFHNDRISEIAAGVSMYEQAMAVSDPATVKQLVVNAIQSLNTGVEKTVRSLKTQIQEAPSARMSFWNDWWGNRRKKAAETIGRAEESFRSALLGVKTLAQCYAVLKEPKSAAKALEQTLSSLQSANIEMAANKARLIPFTGGKPPEACWFDFVHRSPQLSQSLRACRNYADREFRRIAIEARPEEFMEVNHEQM